MKYTVGIIFNNDLTKILLLLRNKDPYKNYLNGVGGKLQFNENPLNCMIREFNEEVNDINGQKLEIEHIQEVVSMNYPSGTQLNMFYIVLKEIDLKIKSETREGQLLIFNLQKINDLIYHNKLLFSFAGEGNLEYLINYSFILEVERRNKKEAL